MPKSVRIVLLTGLLLLISGCAGAPLTEPAPPVFQHDFKGSMVPWTRDNVDNEPGKFIFALFSDLNGAERDGVFEAALSDRPYTVFNGHLHSCLHQQRHGRDYIRPGTTGGSHAPIDPMAIDHATLVMVSGDGVDIAKLRRSGIFDRTGKIPLNGAELCLQQCAAK